MINYTSICWITDFLNFYQGERAEPEPTALKPDGDWENRLEKVSQTLEDLKSGKFNWPYMSIDALEPEQMLAMDEATVDQAMEIVFRTLGPNVELVARLTGYWSDNMSDKKGAAKHFCYLHKQ